MKYLLKEWRGEFSLERGGFNGKAQWERVGKPRYKNGRSGEKTFDERKGKKKSESAIY